MGRPGFWNDQETARNTSKKAAALKKQIEFWEKLEGDIGELEELAKPPPTPPPPPGGGAQDREKQKKQIFFSQ